MPARDRMLPYGRQSIDEDDIAAVVGVLRSDWLTTGPAVPAFEEAFALQVGADYAVAVSSGTAALHAAVFTAGIGPGDEVIVPAMTFAATANCVRYVGGTVVFADVRPDTLNLDPLQAERLITPKTKAIITVGYAGQPSDLHDLRQLCDRYGLLLIEDAAHELGASYHGKPIGSIADLTTFSLHPVKHITTGEGGMITTNSAAFATELRCFRNHGITTDHRQREEAGSWTYDMVTLGFNYRLSDLQCALGLSQLRKLPEWLKRRRDIAATYDRAFQQMPEIMPLTVLPDLQPAWHLYPVQLQLELLNAGRKEIFAALRQLKIGVNVHYIPVPWHPYYQRLGYQRGLWPVAEAAYERLISLPIFPAMTDSDVQDAIDAVHQAVSQSRR